jgi:O-antigen ligase
MADWLLAAAPALSLVGALAAGLMSMLFPVAGLLFYLWLDFMRPQDALPALAAARPMLAIAVGLLLAARRDVATRWRGEMAGLRDWAGVAVLCVAVVPASLLSANTATAAALEPLKLAVVAWLIAHFLGSRRDFDRALLVIAASLTVLASSAIRQALSGGDGFVVVEGPGSAAGGGLFHDNNDLARGLLVGVALWSVFVSPPRARPWRLAALVALAATVEGVVLTGSRGGFVALIVAGGYLLFAHLRPLPAAVTVVALAVVLLRVATPEPIARRMETIARPAAETSVQSRLDIWKEGVRRAAARPLFGHGVGTFAVPHARGPGHKPRTAHNIFVELFYETGILGLTAYLFLLGLTLARLGTLAGSRVAEPKGWPRPRAVAPASRADRLRGRQLSAQQRLPVDSLRRGRSERGAASLGRPLSDDRSRRRPADRPRKVVTIVFADLIGSTALHERLDAESVRRVHGGYYAAMRGAVEAHGGTVTQLLGDGVKAVFGAPRVAEDDAIRAVRAAVAMQESFRALADEQRGRVGKTGLRVAVNTGEVV